MPCLISQFDPAIGPTINVGVLPAGTQVSGSVQVPGFVGLIDTGASMTCISPVVARQVGLMPSGKRPMASATQSVLVNEYIVDFVLPFGPSGFMIQGMQVMEFAQFGGPFQLLIGRDIICQGVLTLSFDGHLTFSV